MTLDLGPATTTLATLVAAVRDEDLARPTPCTEYSVADLVDHVGGLAVAFTGAARKEPVPGTEQGAVGDGSRLEPGFRDRIGADLGALAAAWRDPAAYDGMTAAGGIDLPGDVAAAVALNEVVVHGWDLAVATGQQYAADPADLARLIEFATTWPAEGSPPAFGPVVDVHDDAPDLDRLLGLNGRRADWSAGVPTV